MQPISDPPDALDKVRSCARASAASRASTIDASFCGVVAERALKLTTLPASACERKQILDAVIHLLEKQLLLFQCAPSLGNISGDL